ncbi:Mu transposase C-terminal domain-containing protein [Caballeronia sp. INDeC2]|uniref:Mu transposase C-terminal domain-containing protein n=1 Tax=Caballeronia sp. INDeC2 TaxID=2921747 RepID=UPI0020280992|nr:Mu transposase C-terminal domain-containing protein [Caballeronia sp. INDeC2]
MVKARDPEDRANEIARVLRPLGNGPLTKAQALTAAQLLDVHWTTVYRLRRRFLANPVTGAVMPRDRGPKTGGRRLNERAELIIDEVLMRWLPKQRQLAHPLSDLTLEIRRRCTTAGVQPPSRSSVVRRWVAHREADNLAEASKTTATPGNFVVHHPLDVVQVDHTQADIMLVDAFGRRPIGRPWLSLAIDVATRCVVGFYLSMERPGAATVALLLTRVALPKSGWLSRLCVEVEWPMQGVPKVLHLDNAAEFKSRALRTGCSEYGIELMYRPVGRPHFGGHIERLNRTLMERVHGLPGTTGSSPKGRKKRPPEKHAALTLPEFERWLALEIGQRYHHSAHRGLHGATPASMWAAGSNGAEASSRLPDTLEAEWQFLLRFLPVARRTIQADGLTLFHIRYWHPIFSAWRLDRRAVTVRYHPEDLSRIFVSVSGKQFIEVRFADLRHPPISLWEQRSIVRYLRGQRQELISEATIFRAIEEQRRLVAQAQRDTRKAKHRTGKAKTDRYASRKVFSAPATSDSSSASSPVDYSKPAPAYDVEQW